MTAMTSWLDSLCDPNHIREFSHRPFGVLDVDGRPWIAVTDGRCLLCIRSEEEREPLANRTFHQQAVCLLTMHPGKGEIAVWADLKAWLGPWQSSETCPRCKGKSASCPHHDEAVACMECYCDECEFTGDVGPPMLPGVIARVRLDLNLLARYTAGLSGEEYDLVTLHAVKIQLPEGQPRARRRAESNSILIIENPYFRVMQSVWEWTGDEGKEARVWE